MGRRKKNEVLNNSVGGGDDGGSTSTILPSNVAPTNSAIPVRKSRRQIAQKQQSIDINIDNKKQQNGELLGGNIKSTKNIEKNKNTNQVLVNNIDSVGAVDETVPIIVPRKRGRPRLSGNRNTNKNILSNDKNSIIKTDDNLTVSSNDDSQKIINKLVDSLEITPTAIQTIDTDLKNKSNDNVISKNSDGIVNNNDAESVNDGNDDVEEEIIEEETVICEEMEVEIDNETSSSVVVVVNNEDNDINTASEQYMDNDIVCEQVVVMDESHFEEQVEDDKQENNVVILIDNEIDTMITNTEDVVTTNDYEIIEEGVECLTVNDIHNDSIDYLKNKQSINNTVDESQSNLIDNEVIADNSDNQLIEEKCIKDNDKNKKVVSSNNSSCSLNKDYNNLIDNDNMAIDNLGAYDSSTLQTLPNNNDDDDDDDDNDADTTSKIMSRKILNNDDFIVETTADDDDNNIPTDCAKINENSIEYSDYPQDTNDEESRESETTMMMDNISNENDTKLLYCNNNNSASDNSNDIPSSNNKIDDSNELKNHQNDSDKKSSEFRNRSGSTDTTGSDNGSNSSGIRRSSRIRSQGLMKQRSRGRGLVTKPIADVTKAMQERETITSCSSGGGGGGGNNSIINNQKKDTIITSTSQDNYYNNNTSTTSSLSDGQFDIQSDKENKKIISLDTLTNTTASTSISTSTVLSAQIIPTTISPLTISSSSSLVGYESDTTKPVKVKSRWRRSSELEMCGNTISGYNKSSTTFGNIMSDNRNTAGAATGTATTGTLPTPIGNNNDIAMMTSWEDNSLTTKTKNDNSNIDEDTCNIVDQQNHQQNIKLNDDRTSVLSIIKEEEFDYELQERLRQFERIKENLYLTERFTNKETKKMVCDCFLTDEDIERGELGCGEDCLNRLLMIECGSRCVVNNRCTNKRFQRCEYSKCQVFRTEKKGFGLRATNDILAGEFIMEYVGEVLNPKDFRRRAKEYSKDKNKHYYFMALKSDQIIDATTKGNISRFINHSCDPNSETQKWTVNGELRIGFFNRRFISAGEEITFDYHFQRYGKEAQKCYCDAPNCRGWIGDTPDEEKNKKNKNKNNKAHRDYLKTIITSSSTSSSSSGSESSSPSSSVSSTPSASPAPSRSSSPVPSPSPSPSLVSSTKSSLIKSTLTSAISAVTAATKPKRKTKTTATTTVAKTKKTTTTRKKKEIKKSFVEDEDLDEEIDKLCAIGLKNRVHTLNLSRLMVRSRESEHRNRLLKVIQNGEPACRRLFLDYHGLRLIWSYMMDVGDSNTQQIQQFKLELLKTLDTLPVPNKTMLMDTKVYDVVQKWSINPINNNNSNDNNDNGNRNNSNNNNSHEDDNKIEEKSDDVNDDNNKCDNKIDTTLTSDMEIQVENLNGADDQIKNTTSDGISDNKINDNTSQMIVDLAISILNKWSNLKEVFRIPKKERIEQMKEHEREADSGYIRENIEKEERRESYERTRTDRYSGRRDDVSSLTSTSLSTTLIPIILKDRDKCERRNGVGIGVVGIGTSAIGSGIKGRDSPDLDVLYRNNKDKRNSDERGNLVSVPRLSKYERRQLFALKVAKEEEEERLRKQQQNMWQEHETRCIALGIDPHTTAAIDPQTGYPLYFDPSIGQWQSSYHHSSTKQSVQETSDAIPSPSSLPPQSKSQCNSIYMTTNTQPNIAPSIPPHSHHHHHYHNPQHQHQHPQQHASTNLLAYDNINHQPVPSTYPTSFTNNLITLHNNSGPNGVAVNNTSSISTIQPSHHHHQHNTYSANTKLLSDNLSTITDLPISPLTLKIENNQQQQSTEDEEQVPFLLDLPPKWKHAKDSRGRTYYYHIKERIPQWLPPLPIHIGVQPDDSSSTSESSEDESSTSDDNTDDTMSYDDLDNGDGDCGAGGGGDDDDDVNMIVDDNILATVKTVKKIKSRKLNCNSKFKKRRIGLVQERIISPRREEDRVDHKKYKNIKDKLRRQKEQRGKSKENIHEKVRKHRRANKSKSHARHTAVKLQTIAQSNDLSAERKIKDTFRINMANVIVRFLNPHRQNDCKQGRITNTEDFKFLARKLTHFVLAKELKHCKSVDELQCNENVKHKAKDFVRKYMNKFGSVYQRSSDEDY